MRQKDKIFLIISDLHHEGCWELVASRCPAGGCVVALEDADELPGLVLDKVPVLPPDGADLEHVPHLVPGLLDLESSASSPGWTIVHDGGVASNCQDCVTSQSSDGHQLGIYKGGNIVHQEFKRTNIYLDP